MSHPYWGPNKASWVGPHTNSEAFLCWGTLSYSDCHACPYLESCEDKAELREKMEAVWALWIQIISILPTHTHTHTHPDACLRLAGKESRPPLTRVYSDPGTGYQSKTHIIKCERGHTHTHTHLEAKTQ